MTPVCPAHKKGLVPVPGALNSLKCPEIGCGYKYQAGRG